MTRRVAWLLAVFLVSVWPCAEAFQQVRSGTGPAQDTPAGDAVIAGTVLADDGTPVDRAVVTILGSDGPGLRASVTDAEGKFSIGGLPAGSFALWATKPGFVTSYYGSRRAGRGPAIPIALASGQRLAVQLRMLRGASIAGTITDASGRPLAQVSVQVRPVSSSGTAAAAAQHSATDGQGAYRIFGLAPGEYIVEALPPPMPNPHAILVTAGDVKWALQQVQQGPRTSLGAGGTATAPPEEYAVAYTPTFFPGVAVADQAATVAVGPGEQRDATFSLQLVRAASISGHVLVSGGQPTSRVHLALVRSEPAATPSLSAPAATPPGVLQVPVSDTGQFSVSGVVPGAYTLWARSDPDPPGDAGSPGAPTLWGRATLTVNGSDVSGVVLNLETGARVSGTIRFDGSSQAPALDRVQVTLSPRPGGLAPFIRSLAATPDASGRFILASVPPGPYDVQVGLGELAGSQTVTWALESATVSGHDVADGTLEVRQGEDAIAVAVTLSDRQTLVSGTLFDSTRRPTSQFSLLFFSVDRTHWTPRSRRVRLVQPAVDGTFSVEGLPAGEYFVVAASTDTFGTVDDVYLQQLAGMATRITLARGERHRVDFATTTLNGESAPQAGPDFSGTWTLATSMRAGAIEGGGNNNPAGLRVGPSPDKLVLDQRADRLRIEEHYSIPGGLNTVEYAFNGQPVANRFFLLRSAQEPTVPSEVTTKWQDGKLVATIAVFEPGESAPRHFVRTLSIGPEGRLVVRIQRVGSADARTLFYDKVK